MHSGVRRTRRRRRFNEEWITEIARSLRTLSRRELSTDLGLQDTQTFSTAYKMIADGYTISVANLTQSRHKLYLNLTQEEQRLFNSRNEDSHVQVLIRAGQKTNEGIDWHKVPTDFYVKVNRSLTTVYGTSPINIGNYIRYWPHSSPLQVEIFWMPKLDYSYVVITDLLVVANPSFFSSFISSAPRSQDHTLKNIRETATNGNDEVKVISQEMSLLCPLTKRRLEVPVQGVHCDHIQCFDGKSYLDLNLAKPKWTCPICRKITFPGSLILDGFWDNVLKNCQTNSIFVCSDGSWTPAENKEDRDIITLPSEVISL